MNEDAAEAFLTSEHVLLKRRLQPFTFRHAFLLTVAENSFLVGGVKTTEDVYQFAEICSRPGNKAASGIGTLRRYLWALWTARADFTKEVEKANAYLEDYNSCPKIWQKKNGKEPVCHWIISTIATLMSRFHFSEEEAWDMTPGAASWYIAASYEADPAFELKLVSEQDEKLIDFVKQHQQRRAAE